MNQFMKKTSLVVLILSLFASMAVQAGDAEYKPELFRKTRLVYSDDFNGKLDRKYWEVRQSSTWVVEDGLLKGSQSSKEFQAKKIAQGDKAHAGFKPVIWLKELPENFVCTMRMRYDAKDYHPKFPLLDLGHHIHTLTFAREATTLTIKRDVEKVKVEAPLLPLNQWVDVALELKKGDLVVSIDGKKHHFQSSNIDPTGHHQIDFKGVDFGTCQIDHIRIWEGL